MASTGFPGSRTCLNLHPQNIKSTLCKTKTSPRHQRGSSVAVVELPGDRMPILHARPAVFPEDLLIQTDSSQLPAGCWTVLHARPRQEKSLARDLLDKELPFFLPLFPRSLVIRGRKMTAHLPLFDGYLFLYSAPT